MENKSDSAQEQPVCFVIMPISDMAGYDVGHFGRVYEHLFKPAITAAGFQPMRADDTVKTDYIVTGIVQRVVESALVLCDLSGRNGNVLYELGIRHAFNLPVVLAKDRRTDRVFDIQGLRTADYDESLRVDAVSKDIERLRAAISETAKSDARDYNSVVHLAGIRTASIPTAQVVTPDTKLLLSAINALDKRVSDISQRGSQSQQRVFVTGDRVYFSDGTTSSVGEQVFRNGTSMGNILEIDARRQAFILRGVDGKSISVHATDQLAQELTDIPF